MREEKINGHSVELYDSIDELPLERYRKFCKLALVDSGVGSDLEGMLGHIEKVKVYVKRDRDMAITELENMRQGIYLLMTGTSPRHMAFAAMVAKIDGKPASDLSDLGLEKVLDTLKEAKRGTIEAIYNSIKKKWSRNSASTSPPRSRTRGSKSTTTASSGLHRSNSNTSSQAAKTAGRIWRRKRG